MSSSSSTMRMSRLLLSTDAGSFKAGTPLPRPRLNRDLRESLKRRDVKIWALTFQFVAGGAGSWAFLDLQGSSSLSVAPLLDREKLRTKPRFATALRGAGADGMRDAGAPELTPTQLLAVTVIAYLQPATRAQISQLAGRDISRDVIGALKRHGLIDASLRAPEPGAPFAYVTTGKFLEVFGLASLRELPDVERLEEEELLRKPREEIDLDGAIGLGDGNPPFDEDFEFDEADLG